MCFSLNPTHRGEDQQLVGLVEKVGHGDLDVVAHDLLHCQGVEGDAPGLIGLGKLGNICSGR